MIGKPQLIAKMRWAARRLGSKTLPQGEFRRFAKVNLRVINHHFDDWTEACAAAGLSARNYRVADAAIFAAMREAFVAAGGIGNHIRFMRRFRYSQTVLARRWPNWVAALSAFRDWARAAAPDFPYFADLERSIAKGPRASPKRASPRRASAESAVDTARPAGTGRAPAPQGPTMRGPGPLVGEPIAYRGIVYAPVNEMGVAVLFGAAAQALGFAIESVGVAFPDCLARREVAPGRWRPLRIELEYESRNFRTHRHDPKGCDLLVCWRHNWPECPLPVLELKREIAKLRRE